MLRHLLTFLILCSSTIRYSQKLTINGLKMMPSGESGYVSMIWAQGSSVTRNGHIIPFIPEMKSD